MKNNLNTFRTLFLVKGILNLCFSLFPLIYLFVGLFILNNVSVDDNMLFNPGLIFVVVGIVGFLVLVTIGIITLVASKYIKLETHYKFIFVASIITALTGVLGILLCIFTLIELSKPEVKALFIKDDV
jgi:hypothetical protein